MRSCKVHRYLLMGSVNVSSSDAKGFVGYLLPHPSPPPLLHQKHFFALHSLQFNISTHACFKHTCSHHQNGGGERSEFHQVESHCNPSVSLQCRAQRKQIFMVDFPPPSFAIEVFHCSQIAELQKVEILDCQLKD